MDIQIPQPTALERIKKELVDAEKRLKTTPEDLEASQLYESGIISGLKVAITILELDK